MQLLVGITMILKIKDPTAKNIDASGVYGIVFSRTEEVRMWCLLYDRVVRVRRRTNGKNGIRIPVVAANCVSPDSVK